MKNHPSQEQWMDYLYGEMKSPEKKALETHVKGCGPCREKQKEFAGTMESLDAWRVEVPEKVSLHRGVGRFQPVLKWAAAAALLVTTGFAAARFSQPEIDVSAITAQVAEQVQSPLEQRMEQEVAARAQEIALRAQSEAMLAMRREMEEMAAQLASLRDEDRKRMNQALKAFETQWLAEYRKMREDLERVALFSDESFRKAQQQLVQLASFSQPVDDLDGSENE
jgi:hypothetical protein